MPFDFEVFVSKMLPELDNIDTESLLNPFGAFRGDPKHRTIVCRHWLLGLCQNGATCAYLHRLDRSKMPACKHGKLCKIKNCHLKHIDDQEVSECLFYKQGFCYNGPNCARRHIKRLPDEAPQEAVFDQGISSTSNNTTTASKKKKGGNDNYKVSLCNHWLLSGTCHFGEECHFAHGEEEIQESTVGHQNELINDSDIYDPTRNRMDAELVLPFPLNARISYFLFQSPDLRSLLVSKRRGVWSVPVRFTPEINAALRAYDHVVAYMAVRPLKGIYGVVKIAGQIPTHPPHMQHIQMTPEFPVTWLRLIRISMRTIAQLKIGTTGMFVGRTTTDSKFESKVGSEIMYIAYRKPVWDWSTESQFSLAEQFLVQQRILNGELPPVCPPDSLFGQTWIDTQTYGERKPPIAPSTGASANVWSSVAANPLKSGGAPCIYKQDYPGFIVNAAGPLAAEMLERSIFGLPNQLKDVAIHPGSALFLIDPQVQMLLGVFQATTNLTENLEPQAFINWSDPAAAGNPTGVRSLLPLQVRFSVLVQAPPLMLHDPDLQAVFKEAGGMPMGGPIGLRETRSLANLFALRAGVPIPADPPLQVARKPGLAGIQEASTYKPPFKFVAVVPINVTASAYELKRRLLGTNGSTVVQIATEVAGSARGVKIRIRGIGSGFIEGNNQELQEPLHFNVSAETEEMLQKTVEKVRNLISRVKLELEPPSEA